MDINSVLSLLIILLVIVLALWLVVFFHEMGHALAMLAVTKGEVKIFIGSLGDPAKSFRVPVGRLVIFCKYNPVLWVRGCCRPPDEDVSVYNRMLYIACGPMASLLILLVTWHWLTRTEPGGQSRLLLEVVFFLSVSVSINSLIPIGKVRFTASGSVVHNDAYQLVNLFSMRKIPLDYWTAMRNVRDKDYVNAADRIEQLIAGSRNNAPICRLGVSLYCLSGNYERAMEISGYLAEKHKLNADDYSNLGFLYVMTDRLDDAVIDLRKSLELRYNHPYALNNLGYALCVLGDFKNSVIYLDQAISQNPLFASPYESRALVRMNLGDMDGALKDIQKCLSLDDKNAYAYRNWGIYSMKMGEFDEAELQFQRAKALNLPAAELDKYIEELSELRKDELK